MECESGDYAVSSSRSSLFFSALQTRKRKRRHFHTCDACKSAQRSKPLGFLLSRWSRTASQAPLQTVPDHSPLVPSSMTHDSEAYHVSMSIGGMTCASCVNAIVDALEGKEGVSELNVDLLGKSGSAVVSHHEIGEEIRMMIEDIGYECEIINLKPLSKLRGDATETYRAVLSIGGMTCASCESAISRSLKSLECVRSVEVSFLTHCATAIFETLGNMAQIKLAVEEGGYDCDIINLVPIGSAAQDSSTRTVTLKVDGLSPR